MWGEVVASWPVVPLNAILLLAVFCGGGCLIAWLYDAGARDAGRVTQFGVILLGIGIMGCLGIGMWNMTVSIAKLTVHQNTLASSAPTYE